MNWTISSITDNDEIELMVTSTIAETTTKIITYLLDNQI